MNRIELHELMGEIERKCDLIHLQKERAIITNLPDPTSNHEGFTLTYVLSFLKEKEIECIRTIANNHGKRISTKPEFLTILTPKIHP